MARALTLSLWLALLVPLVASAAPSLASELRQALQLEGDTGVLAELGRLPELQQAMEMEMQGLRDVGLERALEEPTACDSKDALQKAVKDDESLKQMFLDKEDTTAEKNFIGLRLEEEMKWKARAQDREGKSGEAAPENATPEELVHFTEWYVSYTRAKSKERELSQAAKGLLKHLDQTLLCAKASKPQADGDGE